ncbi:MAG: BREX-1 system adenine-specific DNA-methyltransferase PglX [Clostridiales bacterium]|nr:BREX-1 system adenine-specific DNA-methyltransferase PglX [Clostridiales bacterium]
MNKSEIKGFSVRARRILIEDISQKAYALGIKGTGKYDDIEEFEGGFRVKNAVNQIVYPTSIKKDRDKLIAEINRKGFGQIVEEVAYTWFNRIVAIRFMEVNEYLPVKVRILSSEVVGKTEPDVITHIYDYVSDLELDSEKVFNLKENHKDEELFKYVFVKECNNLGKLMPQVFEAIGDFTELLLPDQLLSSGSVIRDLIESIDEEDFKEDVEIIGWMYQYFNIDNNELVYDGTMKRARVPKELLPAATQIFTPKWVVQYMIQNSLGKLCLENFNVSEQTLKKWRYFLQDDCEKKVNPIKINELKVIDPAMGSGHMLVYAFDLLLDVYLDLGYNKKDAAYLILKDNIYGIDIDDRAYQLASFALLMKARKHNRKAISENLKMNLISIKQSNEVENGVIKYLTNGDTKKNEQISKLIRNFIDAKEYGSIIKVGNIDFFETINNLNEKLSEQPKDLIETIYKLQLSQHIMPLLHQYEILTNNYDVVVTNPPYLNSNRMSSKLYDYVCSEYPENKSDFSMVFFKKVIDDLCKSDGYIAFVTTTSWMYLKSFEPIRKQMIEELEFETLVDFGTELFDGKVGHNPIVSWINKKSAPTKIMTAIDLSKFCYSRKDEKKVEFFNKDNWYKSDQKLFCAVPGNTIAYKANSKVFQCFTDSKPLEKFADVKQGVATADNNRFLRLWHEVDITNIGYNFSNSKEAELSSLKWFPYNKGGAYRKWFGNLEYIINWKDNGVELRSFSKSVIRSPQYFFRECLTWSKVTSSGFSVRYVPQGGLFDVAGCSIFSNGADLRYLLGILNSSSSNHLLSYMSNTLNYEVGHISKLPIIINEEFKTEIINMVSENIDMAKDDWDERETSWSYKENGVLKHITNSKLVADSIEKWVESINLRIAKIIVNEDKLNKLTERIYGFGQHNNGRVEPGIKNDMSKYDLVISFVSYYVGVIMGRYSIDEKGFCFAGGQFDPSKFKSFKPCNDNVILMIEDDYFENDILHRFVEFLKFAFSEETLEENLKYIADVLNPNSRDTPRQTIRNYFVKDFYNDHVKMYKKRPIYWMIDSGKQNGIKALFYMHRYDKSTIARFRTDYLHEIQRYYENDIELTEKSNDKKKVDNLKKKLQEVTEFDKVVAHIAHQQIEFDLDDGVDHNYELFQGVEVPQGDGQKPMKADLLAKRK